jgi:polyhydroxyalkanoate synthesis regulator phasin
MNTDNAVNQIDDVLNEFKRAKSVSPHNDLSGGLSNDELMSIRIRMDACIQRLAPEGSTYRDAVKQLPYSHGHFEGYAVISLAGILNALRDDYKAGYTKRIEELVHGLVFDDFLEMASELFSKGYKDSSAVIAGSVLEEHIKKMALSSNVAVMNNNKVKKFDLLAIELVKSGMITEPERKIITGWYSQRSEAAHGNYANVISDEVKRMIDGIRDFMVRHPA